MSGVILLQPFSPSTDTLRLPILYNADKQKQWARRGDGIVFALLALVAYFQISPLVHAYRSHDTAALVIFGAGAMLYFGRIIWSERNSKANSKQHDLSSMASAMATTLTNIGLVAPHGVCIVPLAEITGFALTQSQAYFQEAKLTLFYNGSGRPRKRRSLLFDTNATTQEEVRAWMQRHNIAEKRL